MASAFTISPWNFSSDVRLANNVTNLLLEPLLDDFIHKKNIDWLALLEKEPDAGLGNGGLGRLAACFLDSMATMQLPAMGYGLRYEYGMFKQTIKNGWQREVPDNWLRRTGPVGGGSSAPACGNSIERLVRHSRWRSCAPFQESLAVFLGFLMIAPSLATAERTINTLRLWAAAARGLL